MASWMLKSARGTLRKILEVLPRLIKKSMLIHFLLNENKWLVQIAGMKYHMGRKEQFFFEKSVK